MTQQKPYIHAGGPTRITTHGYNKTPTHYAWAGMLQRCRNQNSKDYPRYGGRGITVCKRWYRFENFLADMGEKPKGRSLDRINNNKGYCKSNCRWATQKEQSNNTRVNRVFTYRGSKRNLKELANEHGMSHQCLRYRIANGLTLETALSLPVNHGNNYRKTS